MDKGELFDYLNLTLGFANKSIQEAFLAVDRQDFVLPEYQDQAYFDYPLPIGFGQTISQPTTVAFMLNQLDPRPGEKVLDIGAGSGWTTALLVAIVGKTGEVLGLEIVPELVKFGQENLNKYRFSQAKILQAHKSQIGLPGGQGFNKILISATAEHLPDKLIEQLAIGGRLVLPIKHSIWQIDKISETKITQQEYPGFVFVPLK